MKWRIEMSRSRKKTGGFTDYSTYRKDFKRFANKKVRNMPIEMTADGGLYKKLFCSYDICDWKSLVFSIRDCDWRESFGPSYKKDVTDEDVKEEYEKSFRK